MTFKDLVDQIVNIGDQVIMLLYALAFLFFLAGVFRFFFTGSATGREKWKQFILWGLVGLVVLFAVWGLVHLLLATFVQFGT